MSSECEYLILSIDDSKAVHAFLDRCLQDPIMKGFQFVHTYGVKEGLLKLQELGSKVSLVLLDWEMPELSGFEGLPLILRQNPGLSVIMLTSKNEPNDILKILELGAKDYMMKPFTTDILKEKLTFALGDVG